MSCLEEEHSKKVRKPYTITKSRESWTEQEHDKFLEALQLFDRDWKKIEAFVGSKTVIQIRSHAQKYFLKVEKNGTGEHVPPPRPKRKASHPYPQKAPKNAPVAAQVLGTFQSSPTLVEAGYIYRPDTPTILRNPIASTSVTSNSYNAMPPVNVPHGTKDDVRLAQPFASSCYSSSNDVAPRMWSSGETTTRLNYIDGKLGRAAMPDFSQVYSFIGSLFDPNSAGHLQRLKELDPLNLETVLLLMRNLSVNLISPEFEDHRKLLSTYKYDTEKAKTDGPYDKIHLDKSGRAILSA